MSADQAVEKETQEIIRELPRERLLVAMKNRILQGMARSMPGSFNLRVLLHRWRGVKLGERVHIAPDVIIETAYPQWVSIGNDVQIGIRVTILAHIHGMPPLRAVQNHYVSVRIEDSAYIGPGVIICPNVTIGKGAVVSAGSVVTHSVPPSVMVRGNPAEPVALCGVPLTWNTPYKEFLRAVKPLK